MQSATNWDERMRDARFAPGVYSVAAISQRSRYKVEAGIHHLIPALMKVYKYNNLKTIASSKRYSGRPSQPTR